MDNLLYIINGEVNECIIGTNVWTIYYTLSMEKSISV